jgi:hypothetical protein
VSVCFCSFWDHEISIIATSICDAVRQCFVENSPLVYYSYRKCNGFSGTLRYDFGKLQEEEGQNVLGGPEMNLEQHNRGAGRPLPLHVRKF